MRISTLIILVITGWALMSCNGLKKALNKGLQDQNRKVVLDSLGKKIGKGVVAGATEELSSDATAQRLGIFLGHLTDSINASTRVMLDSLVENDTQLKAMVAGIVDTLDLRVNESVEGIFQTLNNQDLKELTNRLKQRIRDLELTQEVDRIRSTLLGEKALVEILHIRDSLLGERTRQMAKGFMGEMVDEEATKRLQEAIRESIDPTIEKVFTEVNRSTEQGLNFAQRNIAEIVVLVSLLGAAISFFFKNQRDRYNDLVRNLTLEIENMDDEEAAKDLKKNIRDKTTAAKLEPLLRGILVDQGIVKDR